MGSMIQSLSVVLLLAASAPVGVAQDLGAGRELFLSQCLGCHAFTCNKTGPRLGGLVGRQVGSLPDYGNYSEGLREAGFVWTVEVLDDFLADPPSFFPDSIMAYPVRPGRIEDPRQRADLIAFLQSEDPSVNLCPDG